MKRIIGGTTLVVCLLAAIARADTVLVYSNSVNAVIPDGNPVGLASSANISYAGPETGIVSVQVALNITGGFNGDLYAYLLGPNGGLAVLLNRAGLTAGNPFGYGDTGFNITLGDGFANNIHNYQGVFYSITSGQLVGNWTPDGRNINPQSTGAQFDAASTSANLGTFVGSNLNGQWTLFLADLAGGGGNSTLVSWGLTIAVPEPQTWALLISGGAMLLAMRRRR
jgi:subtilisin-like proprotein convertase family protein